LLFKTFNSQDSGMPDEKKSFMDLFIVYSCESIFWLITGNGFLLKYYYVAGDLSSYYETPDDIG